jgi:hypothetical protein
MSHHQQRGLIPKILKKQICFKHFFRKMPALGEAGLNPLAVAEDFISSSLLKWSIAGHPAPVTLLRAEKQGVSFVCKCQK